MAGHGDSPNVIEHLQVRLDRRHRTAAVAGQPLSLTGTEFRLLEVLLGNIGETFSRPQLVQAVIAGGAVVLERTIDVHICALRRKLGTANVIETVRGAGYRIPL